MIELNDINFSSQGLVDTNHHLLNAIGVGHPSLDVVHNVAKQFNLSGKMTGAGGGGCAFIVSDDDLVEADREKLLQKLHNEGIQCWNAKIGCPGVQILQIEEIT